MRPKTLNIAAAGATTWMPVNYMQTPFGIGFRATLSDGGSATFKVQHGLTDPDREHPFVTITRSTTTATITFPNANYAFQTGDAIYVTGSGDANLDGWFDLASVPSSTTATYTVANTGATASVSGAKALIVHVGDHAVVTGKTASVDGNYAFPINYIRLKITTYASGSVNLTVLQGTQA